MKTSDPIRVLVVEDDMTLLPLWEAILADLSPTVEIHWAVNGLSAREKLAVFEASGQRVDLIIADLFISGGETGLDLWRQYRDRVQAFALTSGTTAALFRSLFASGAIGAMPMFIPKPIDPASALKQLCELVNKTERVPIHARLAEA